ncbi:unnamed protein product, partial [Adineta steineri]
GVSRGPSKLLSKFMPDEHRKDAPKSPGNKYTYERILIVIAISVE